MNLGRIGLVPQGEFNPLKPEYKPLDIVTFEGNLYIVKEKTIQGQTPHTNPEKWMLAIEGVEGGVIDFDNLTPAQKDELRFRYENFTQSQINEFKQPAIEAAALANQAATNADTAAGFATVATQEAVNATGQAIAATAQAENAAENADEAAVEALAAKDAANQAAENALSGIKDEATPATVPSPTGFERWIVHTAGTYTNFSGIVVSAADLDVVNGVANNEVILEVDNGVAVKRVYAKRGAKGDPADPAKLPLYSAIKSANIPAGTQFIDDENGNIEYRVRLGQTLLTTELPVNVVGTKVDVIGLTKSVKDKLLQKFPLTSALSGGNLNQIKDVSGIAYNLGSYPLSYINTTNTYLNSIGISKLAVRPPNGSANVEIYLELGPEKRSEYLAKSGKYIKARWYVYSKTGALPTTSGIRLGVIGITDSVTFTSGKVTYKTVASDVFEIVATWKNNQATLPTTIQLSTVWESANIPSGTTLGDLGATGAGVWYADTLGELETEYLQNDWQSGGEVLTKSENDIRYTKSGEGYGGSVSKYINLPHIQTSISPFLIKLAQKKVDAFNQLNVATAGNSIMARQTPAEMSLTPDVNGGVGNGYDTGHFPPNMYNKNIPYNLLNMLQFTDADVRYFNAVAASEIVKTGTWTAALTGNDALRLSTTTTTGSTLKLTVPAGHTFVKFLHSNYSINYGFGAVLKAEFSTDGGSTWVTPESLGVICSYANNGTAGNYTMPTDTTKGKHKWVNLKWRGLNASTNYQIKITLVSGNMAAWGFETWNNPRINMIVTAEGGNVADTQKTFPQRFFSEMYNQDLIIYELPYLNDLGSGIITNYKGSATASSSPAPSPTINDFYYASEDGTYTNFNGITAKKSQYIEWTGASWRVGNTSLNAVIDTYITNNSAVLERLRIHGVPVLCIITHDSSANRPFMPEFGPPLMRLLARKYGFSFIDINYYAKVKGITNFLSDGTHLNDVGVVMYADVLKEVFNERTFSGLSFPRMENKTLKGTSNTNTVVFPIEFKEVPTVRTFNNSSIVVTGVTHTGFTVTGTGAFEWEAQIL